MKFYLKTKAAALFAVMGLLIAITVGAAAYSLSYQQVTAAYTTLAFDSARMAAEIAGGDDLDYYLANGPDEQYAQTFALLQTLKKTYNLKFLYIIRPLPNSSDAVYIFDIYTEEDDLLFISELGELEPELDVYDTVLNIYLAGEGSGKMIVTNNNFGHLALAYVPVYAIDGSITAVAGADVSMDIVLRDARRQAFQIAGAMLSITALFFTATLLLIQKNILNHVVRLSRYMKGFSVEMLDPSAFEHQPRGIQGGVLQKFEIVRTGDELEDMSESFNKMMETLILYMQNLEKITADRERISAELNVAKTIQASMLPCIFPAFPQREEFDVYGSMLPAKEVGGDFYDFFLIDNNTLAVVIADVSDKGVPAALFMVVAKTLIKNNAQDGKTPKEVFEAVNNLLCENNEANMFVTAFMGILEISTGRFTYVNAGHNPPILCRKDSLCQWLPVKPGFVLSGMEDISYEQDEIILINGDMIFLYTDGVTEAANKEQRLFGERKLLEICMGYHEHNIITFLASIQQKIDAFVDGAEQSDDITMLALQVTNAVFREILLEADIKNLSVLAAFIETALEGCSVHIKNQIQLAAEEIFVNIANYAYTPETGSVTIRLRMGDEIEIEFEDGGIAYDPLSSEDPVLSLDAEEREVGGLGVFMVKQLMDSAVYRRAGDKNILAIKKRIW